MERCKYCGGETGHAVTCPTRYEADAASRDGRESGVPGVTAKEAHMLVGIVDTWRHLDDGKMAKVTRENAAALIEAEVRDTAALRRERNARDLAGLGPKGLVQKLYDRNSSSHAFQCSVNKAEDFGAYFDGIRKQAADKGLAEDPDAAFLFAFLRRQERMHDLMTGLLEKDIARRFGERKGDPGFYEDAMRDFPALAENVLASLDELERADAAQFAVHEDALQQVGILRERLRTAMKETPAEADLYGDICMLYSVLVFTDSENFNAEAVEAAAKRLEQKLK